MPFQIIRNDITKVSADAIVNTANPRPIIGEGTDSAIYRAAGEKELLAERMKIGAIARGQAVSTPAFNLNAKYIIHTAGPVWEGGNHHERDTLHACYANSLALAAELSCQSIAFPMISTGVYGFPKDEALDIALKEIGKFLLTHDMEITLVVFDRNALELSEKLVGDINEYIDDHSVGILRDMEYGAGQYGLSRRRRTDFDSIEAEESAKEMCDLSEPEPPMKSEALKMPLIAKSPEAPANFRSVPSKNLDKLIEEILKTKEDTFQERLFKLIDERHLSDPEVYKKANIDRKVFSKIRCNPDYRPKKKTAVAFAIALELDMPAMLDLLSRAEIAFSPSSKFDLIISYFINNKIYDIYKINSALFKYGQPLLGC